MSGQARRPRRWFGVKEYQEMKRRALWLGLLLLATMLSEGCCWCNRPFIFRPWRREAGCCSPCSGTSYFGGGGCGCDAGGMAIDHYGAPPIASPVPGGPIMPNAAPLSRMRFAN
jgi:hypothetical protein